MATFAGHNVSLFSLGVAAVCDSDSLHAGEETLESLDDEGRLQSLPRCHDSSPHQTPPLSANAYNNTEKKNTIIYFRNRLHA